MKNENPFRKNYIFVLGIVFTVIEGILAGISNISVYLLINLLITDSVTHESILKLTVLLAVIFMLHLVLYGIGYTQSQVGGAAVSKQIRLFLGEKFRKILLARFTQGQVGQYVNTMTSDVNSYEQILTHKVGSLTKNITLMVMLLLFEFYLYIPAGVILILASLLLIPNLWISFRVVKKYGTAKNNICADTVSNIVEYITGLQTLRVYGSSGVKNKNLTSTMKNYSDVCYQYEKKGIPVGFGFNMLVYLTVPVVMYVASNPWKEGVISGVDYLMLSMLPILVTKLLSSISIDLFSYKNLKISKDKIQQIVEEKEETGSIESFVPNSREIRFENVSFSYVPGENVLKGVSFCAEDRKLTAIVGDSGAGKSTILNLIAKYYEVNEGVISIGGKATANISAERILEQISMVDQDVFLFDDTIRENVRYARPNATDAEIEAACKEANCHGFIQRMEMGYDTRIGENGNRLSGGERQRLSIARAILKNSPILLLDEATASLDIENELAVKQAIVNLLKARKTVIMIAHTLSVVKNADKIIVIEDGKVSESGTHEELLVVNGKYAAMWKAEQEL